MVVNGKLNMILRSYMLNGKDRSTSSEIEDITDNFEIQKLHK